MIGSETADLALLTTAIAGLVASVGTVVIQVMILRRTRTSNGRTFGQLQDLQEARARASIPPALRSTEDEHYVELLPEHEVTLIDAEHEAERRDGVPPSPSAAH